MTDAEDRLRGIRQQVASNWQLVQDRVHEACRRCSRDPSDVTILGVTKYVGMEATSALITAGCFQVAESRPQSLWQKQEALRSAYPLLKPEWHLIGHLQRNKVRRTLPLLHTLQTLDSQRLAEQLQADAASLNLTVRVLLEVNISQDQSKTGLAPELVASLVDYCINAPNLRLEGLMGMSTLGGEELLVRREFASLRHLKDQLCDANRSLELPHLSMGMSGDFEHAIAEGATMVRIGSALFEGLVE